MSKALSLKMNETIFAETERITRRIKVPRNAYINQAVDFYNRWNNRRSVRKQLVDESRMVRQNSMRINEEFEAIEDSLGQ